MQPTFEWDDEKDAVNQAKHQVSFREATRAFFDPFNIVVPDADHSVEEGRFLLLGFGSSHLLTVVYTERKDKFRIISCRRANFRERKTYERSNRR